MGVSSSRNILLQHKSNLCRTSSKQYVSSGTNLQVLCAAADDMTDLLNPNIDALDDLTENSTIDQLTASSRNKAQKDASTLQKTIEATSEDLAMQEQQKPNPNTNQSVGVVDTAPETDGAEDLENQADQEGAFNPVTGEINWDCPCLGGMAYGPCGEQFRSAFSCFVYSNEEPKGMECIDKFQAMQDCFRAHPEVYKDEIEDNEALDDELAQEREELKKEISDRRAAIEAQESSKASSNDLLDTAGADPAGTPASATTKKSGSKRSSKSPSKSDAAPQKEAKTTSHTPSEYSLEKETAHGAGSRTISDRKPPSVSADAVPESESLVPKAAHDATGASDDTHSRAL